MLVKKRYSKRCDTDLRPTAAFFLSERNNNSTDVTMAIPQSSMDPAIY